MTKATILLAVVCGAAVWACGGSGNQSQSDTTTVSQPVKSSRGTGDQLIPPEKFDEIQRTFERKRPQVSRCFVVGVEAGEVKNSDKGVVSIGATIAPGGKARDVKILESSFGSKALEGCVIEMVESWDFTEVPQPIEYSFQYRLEQF